MNTHEHVRNSQRRHPCDASHSPPYGVFGCLQVVVNQLCVGDLKGKDEEEAVDTVEAWRDVEVAPRGVTIAVLVEERLHHGCPVVGFILGRGLWEGVKFMPIY